MASLVVDLVYRNTIRPHPSVILRIIVNFIEFLFMCKSIV